MGLSFPPLCIILLLMNTQRPRLLPFSLPLSFLLPILALALCPAGFGQYSPKEMKEMQSKVQALVKKATPATVALVGRAGTGSGVIIDKDGTILTAAHVMGSSETMTVVFPDGKRAQAKVLGGDYARDIGMVKITDEGEYPFVKVGDSDTIEPTTIVITLGHPGGFDAARRPPVRIGRAYNSGKTGRFIRSDCTLIGGDSGGPLFNLDGEVIGIHSSIGESLVVNNHAPVNVATKDWDRMKSGEQWGRSRQGSPDQPVMGVRLSRESRDGVLVDEVFADSPGEKAGLKDGDVIVRFDGQEVKQYENLFNRLIRKKAGNTVAVKVKRGEETLDLKIKLERRGDYYSPERERERQRRERERENNPDEPEGSEESKPAPAPGPRPKRPEMEKEDEGKKAPEAEPAEPAKRGFLGVAITPADDGIRITEVIAGTGAQQAGLRVGDLITKIDGKAVATAPDLIAAIGSRAAGAKVSFDIRRDGKTQTVEVTLGERPE